MVEAMVAGGARKSADAYEKGARELCEDCAGYLSFGEFIIFWICDGRSNDHVLLKRHSHPGLNSRILAQDLSDRFASVMMEAAGGGGGFAVDLQKELLGSVADDWLVRLNEYIAGVERQGKLDRLLAAMPQMGDGTYAMEWSSTLLGGVYDQGKRALDMVNFGDCCAVAIGGGQPLVTKQSTPVCLGATLSPGGTLQVDVRARNVDAEWYHIEDVRWFIAISDGLSANPQSLLLEMEAMVDIPVSGTRRHLLARGELTYDDQAVIIGRLVPERSNTDSGSGATLSETGREVHI